MQNKKIIFAHRGQCGGNAPENSLAAFSYAVSCGFGIELDVRLSSDGIPVVFHDRTLKRIFGNSRRVSSLDFAEIKKLRIGESCETVPSLAEVLELVSGRVPLLIETKLPKRHLWFHTLERKLIPILREYKGEYLLQSFNKYSMKFMKKRLPEIQCGILSGRAYAEPSGFDFVNYKLSELEPAKISELKKKYGKVYAWSTHGFNAEIGELLDVDGIVM